MHEFQLRSAFKRTRHACGHAAQALALALLAALSACGGSDPGDSPASTDATELSVRVTGADGASVGLRPLDRESARQVTVRVARDGSGAPLLGDGLVPLGAVYQFTPLGWIEEAIEIRVPFSGTDNGTDTGTVPHLLIAQPGGDWAEVADARVDGHFMVARVPQLAYATVVATAAPEGAGDLIRALGLALPDASSTRLLALSLDAVTTTPAWPAPGPNGTVTVTSPTSLGLKLQYIVPSGCTITPTVGVSAAVWNPVTQKLRVVSLGSRKVTSTKGNLAFTQPLSSSDNGTWVFSTHAICLEPVGLMPRYIIVTAGPPLVVNIGATTPTPPPVISTPPMDTSVVEGTTATFSVTAVGTALGHEWQRSNDGGATYTALAAANGASYSLPATLSDNNAMFRVRVSNANGSTTSTPARLTVTQKVVAPTVSSDPANQTVIEGETASFSVSGTGQPAPTVQWQQRAAGQKDPEAGWADIAGATGHTHTTAATARAQDGTQFRAVLRNPGGTVSTLAANLTVNARIIAPAIVTGPLTQTVPAGTFGLFSVTASGTTPLSYQWFKNGAPIAGANATELLVLADPADAGGSYQITVQVSNSAGSVMSGVAALSITTSADIGTPITAEKGGFIESDTGNFSLSIPVGSLAVDSIVFLKSTASTTIGLPPEFFALSDVIGVGPSNLRFDTPVTLSVHAPDAVPEGTMLALVELKSSGSFIAPNTKNIKARQDPAQASASSTTPNLRRLSKSRYSTGGASIVAAGDVLNVLCLGADNFVGGNIDTLISNAGRFIVSAVPSTACTSRAPATPLNGAPTDQKTRCTDDQYISSDLYSATLLNRHVNCQVSRIDNFRIASEADSYGEFRIEVRSSVHGPSNVLQKALSISFRITRLVAGTRHDLPTLSLRPKLICGVLYGDFGECSVSSFETVDVIADSRWSNPINAITEYKWNDGGGTYRHMGFTNMMVDAQIKGKSLDDGASIHFPVPPAVRCDKKMGDSRNDGCIFPEAAAVYLVSSTINPEAALHISEAQQGIGLPNGNKAPGRFILQPGTRAIAENLPDTEALQRSRLKIVKDANRYASCQSAESLFKSRPHNASSTCAENVLGCECDEYPFATTYNGGAYLPDQTSVKRINGKQNKSVGGGLPRFFQSERVIDFTQIADGPYIPIDAIISSEYPKPAPTDNFFVHVR